jgi:hypothetical protein
MQVILASMLGLWNHNSPTYPIHDCLICRENDVEVVKTTINKHMVVEIGATPILDVKKGDKNG